jgi:hypothetical protein
MTLSPAETIQFKIVPWSVNNEMKSMSKEAIVAKFEVLSWNSFGGTEENRKKTQPS